MTQANISRLISIKNLYLKEQHCKVKRFTLNSVKNLFTNLSKDYFLSIVAEDAAKAANTLLLLKKVCAKILIESYKLIMQAVTSYARYYYRAQKYMSALSILT
ncbi:hypothetical protein HBI24_141740 [Parastagonospora nodorum]|nr:hypothetical protein HBI24_141740 [Parastagonospora nodorum]